MKKILLISFSILTIILIGGVAFSPFGKHEGWDYKLLYNTVEIDAPVDSVYQFLGNSDNASKWSVFVNHIVPLNTHKFADGEKGSSRRCFQQANEQGIQWDEDILIAEKNKRRQLSIYNMKGFSMQADGIATEQLYQTTADGKCQLTFTVFYLGEGPGIIDLFKTYYSAFQIKSIFEGNMNNIKRLVEEKCKGKTST